MSMMMFSSDKIQKMMILISNIVIINSIAYNDLNANPFIECLLMTFIITKLSQAIQTCPVVHCLCHNRKV